MVDFYIDDSDDSEDIISDDDCISGHEDHDRNVCNIKVGWGYNTDARSSVIADVGEEIIDDDDGLDEDDIDQIDNDDTLSDDTINVSSNSESHSESIELDSQGLGSFYNDVENTKEY